VKRGRHAERLPFIAVSGNLPPRRRVCDPGDRPFSEETRALGHLRRCRSRPCSVRGAYAIATYATERQLAYTFHDMFVSDPMASVSRCSPEYRGWRCAWCIRASTWPTGACIAVSTSCWRCSRCWDEVMISASHFLTVVPGPGAHVAVPVFPGSPQPRFRGRQRSGDEVLRAGAIASGLLLTECR